MAGPAVRAPINHGGRGKAMLLFEVLVGREFTLGGGHSSEEYRRRGSLWVGLRVSLTMSSHADLR